MQSVSKKFYVASLYYTLILLFFHFSHPDLFYLIVSYDVDLMKLHCHSVCLSVIPYLWSLQCICNVMRHQRVSRRFSRKFKRCFKETWVFQQSFNGASRVLEVWRKFQWCFKEECSLFWRSSKSVSRKILKFFKGISTCTKCW